MVFTMTLKHAAEAVLRKPMSDHPLIATREADNRGRVDIIKLDDTSLRAVHPDAQEVP